VKDLRRVIKKSDRRALRAVHRRGQSPAAAGLLRSERDQMEEDDVRTECGQPRPTALADPAEARAEIPT
jgi:hypothetical protein